MAIIKNDNNIATGKIYNIGNPSNNWSVRELAEKMLALAGEVSRVRGVGEGRQAYRMSAPSTTTARAIKTCRIVSRKSTTPARN